MTFEQVKGIFEELRDRYEAQLTECGVKCETEIYCEDEKLEKTENAEDAAYFSLDINVFTEKTDKENGLCFCASVPVNKMRIDDDEMINEQKAFEASVGDFIGKLALAADADELIKEEGDAAERQVEEMMRDLERRIKKTNTIALIAVGVCAVAAVVAVVLNIIL